MTMAMSRRECSYITNTSYNPSINLFALQLLFESCHVIHLVIHNSSDTDPTG